MQNIWSFKSSGFVNLFSMQIWALRGKDTDIFTAAFGYKTMVYNNQGQYLLLRFLAYQVRLSQ